MSIESKIEANTAALVALTAAIGALVGMNASPPAQVAPTQQPQATPSFGGAPAQPAPSFGGAPAALPNGMPGGPSFGAPVVPAVPAGPVAPFADQKGLADYTMTAFTAIEQKRPGTGEALVNALLSHLCGSASINDLPAAKYGEFYAEMERQRAA